jgi:hypothetical protein
LTQIPYTNHFTSEDGNATVAARLTRGEVAVYDCDAVTPLLKFIGSVAQGGEAITLSVGSDLWNLLAATTHTSIKVGELALKSACWIVSHGETVVVDGVTWTVKSGVACLKVVADFLRHLLPCHH